MRRTRPIRYDGVTRIAARTARLIANGVLAKKPIRLGLNESRGIWTFVLLFSGRSVGLR
jgi:hypothetical protein